MRPGSPIPFVPGAALLVRSDVTSGPELFDPALRGGEDVDLVWRLGEAGWDVRYVPSSTVAHDGPAALGPFLARQAFYGSTAGPLALRHGEALAPVHTSAWSLAVWGLALARRPVLAQATLGGLRGHPRQPPGRTRTRPGGGGGPHRGRAARRASALPALGNLVRVWSPVLLLGLASRRTRKAAALALLVPVVRDWANDPGTLDPVRYAALHVADDAAYGVGVWAGCARARTVVPLVPRISWRSRVWSSRQLRRNLAEAGRRLSHVGPNRGRCVSSAGRSRGRPGRPPSPSSCSGAPGVGQVHVGPRAWPSRPSTEGSANRTLRSGWGTARSW